MGLFNFIRNWKEKRVLTTMPEDKLGFFVGEYLKRTQKEHAEALRTAQNLNKASLLDMQTKKLKTEMRDLLSTDDEDAEEYEDAEEEDSGDFGDKMFKDLVSQFIKSRVQPQQDNPAPAAPSINTGKIQQIIGSLSPEQKDLIKKNYGIDL